MPESIGQH